jgi:hypothetical protein
LAFLAFWPSSLIVSLPNTHLHLIRVFPVGLHLLLLWYVCS